MLWRYTIAFLTSRNYKKAVDVLVSTAQRFKFHTYYYLSSYLNSKGNKEAVLAASNNMWILYKAILNTGCSAQLESGSQIYSFP